jgi:hypothetical protein
MFYKFLILSSFLIFLSCKNDEPLTFTLKGSVKDAVSNDFLSEGEVSVFSIPAASNVPKFEGSTQIASNGSYEITIDRNQYIGLEIIINKTGYFESVKNVKFSELNATEDNIIPLTTTAKSWIRFNVKNTLNPSSDDEFKYLKSFGKENCTECCENGYTYFYGEVDTNIICINDGGAYFGYYYWVNGNQIFESDSVITPRFDTLVIDVEY